MNRESLTPTADRLDYWVGRGLDFLAGAGFTFALFALGFFIHY